MPKAASALSGTTILGLLWSHFCGSERDVYTVCFLLLLPRGGVGALAVGVICACHLERRGMQQPWRSHAGSGRAAEIRPSQPELQELTKRRNNFS